MQHRVFRPADVQINRHPVSLFLCGENLLIILRIEIAKIIPARASPLRHGVRFTTSLESGLFVDDVHPIRSERKRRFRCPAWLEFLKIRQAQRKLAFVERLECSIFKMKNRNRFTPVTLTREEPIAQLVLHLSLSQSLRTDPLDHSLLCIFKLQAVERHFVICRAYRNPVCLVDVCFFADITTGNNFHDRQIEFLRKLVVAFIVAWHRHNRARAVSHQHIIGNPNRDLMLCCRVDCEPAGRDAGLGCINSTLKIALELCLIAILFNGTAL